ncbi:MAG: 1-deoxy-D-xylulose-5-phosphate synthase N-terminal domain-containing protein, partial [Candidatus Azambacteria bacterium]|nr:1-deoxy-D-xylulose-5-phosphate synthase N-terminal domain-containing protein [Candidatus Azambacteria bacterium]
MLIKIIPQSEFTRVWQTDINLYSKLSLIADMCRINALSAVKRAGSGHLGSSFSAMDIVVWLYWWEMNTIRVGFNNPNRDIYFSSKGHDVPGLYAALFSLGIISEELFLKLRRLGGLHGHPDVSNFGIEANSGSLGMGISKGRGMALAKKHLKLSGRIFVVIGDGELQEGQNYEALQGAAHLKQGQLTVILDHNKVQSDKLVKEITDLGGLEKKFSSFGWHVERCDGNDFRALGKTFAKVDRVKDKPKVIIADTIKGRGVSFMEHPYALKKSGTYKWHAGAPDDASYKAAFSELLQNINCKLTQFSLSQLVIKEVCNEQSVQKKVSDEYVVKAYGDALLEQGTRRDDLIVLDADL